MSLVIQKSIAILFLFFLATNIFSSDAISLDLKQVKLKDALHILAKQMQLNVVISPTIRGVTSLQLKNISAEDAFNSLLSTHQLHKWQINHVWYVGPETERLTQQETLMKITDTMPLSSQFWQIRYAKAEHIAKLLQDSLLSKRGVVKVDERTNILYVHDVKERLRDINRLIMRVDIPVKQVLIEAKLFSVDSDYECELGFDYSIQTKTATGLTIATLGHDSALKLRLHALEKSGHGEIIANPSLFTANQQTASIEAGEEIPYQEVSSSGATGVAFKKAVLSLSVTPLLMPKNQVLLQLKINQDKPSKRMVLGVPAIITRQINTQILVKSGQTVVLGGIYEANQELDKQQVPFLGKIPLVGWLFRQQNVTKSKRELLIFVTPKIMM